MVEALIAKVLIDEVALMVPTFITPAVKVEMIAKIELNTEANRFVEVELVTVAFTELKFVLEILVAEKFVVVAFVIVASFRDTPEMFRLAILAVPIVALAIVVVEIVVVPATDKLPVLLILSATVLPESVVEASVAEEVACRFATAIFVDVAFVIVASTVVMPSTFNTLAQSVANTFKFVIEDVATTRELEFRFVVVAFVRVALLKFTSPPFAVK